MRSSNNLNNLCCTPVLLLMRRTLPPLIPNLYSLFENIEMFLICHLFPSRLLCEHSTVLKRLYSLLFRLGSVAFLGTHLDVERSSNLAGKQIACLWFVMYLIINSYQRIEKMCEKFHDLRDFQGGFSVRCRFLHLCQKLS
jgi:hypothetical protein